MDTSQTRIQRPLICPSCEQNELREFGNRAARCGSCGCVVAGSTLETLRGISYLPDALGRHPCECGHPEMRLLPGRIYRCPACGSEILPVDAPAVSWKSNDRAEAYWEGWIEGRYRGPRSFANNPRLAKWEDPTDRIEFYRGHRAGSEARRQRASLPKAS